MPYGKILVDQIESSTGKLLNTGEVVNDLQSIARSLNRPDSDVGYGDDGLIVKPILYAKDQQVVYSVPADAIGKTISSVVGSTLNTTEPASYLLRPVSTENIISVSDFGDIPGDGITDVYSEFQKCADYASSLSIALNQVISVHIPAGDHRLSDQVVFSVGLGGGARGITLFGDGIHSSRIIADENNSNGCIKFTSDGNTELWNVRGLSVVSPLAYDDTRNNGTAIHIESTLAKGDVGFGEQPNRTVMLEDVFIGPYGNTVVEVNGGGIGNFNKCIEIRNKWWPQFKNVYIRGSVDQLIASMTGREYAIYCYNCYSPEFLQIQITGFFENGIYCDQNTDEDFRLQDSFLVGQYKGFSVIHPVDQAEVLYEPGGSISNCHINSHNTGIHIRYHRQVTINNNYFYVPQGNKLNQGETGVPASIWLEGTADITGNNNQFLEPGFFVDEDNTSVGIKITYKAVGNYLSDNHFNCGGTGVYIDSGVTNSVTLDNNHFGGMSVWGSIVNKLTDKSNKAVMSDWWESDALGWSQRTVESKGTPPSGAPLRDVITANRTDYATKSDGQIYDDKIQGPTSDGTIKGITHSYSFADNNSASPILSYTLYMNTSEGNSQMYNVKTPVVSNDSCLALTWYNGATLISKRVTVGDADSGGVGKRLLTIGN